MNVLLITTFSPPVTGQSIASDELLNSLGNDKKYCVDIVNLSKDSLKNSTFDFTRLFQLYKIFIYVFFKSKNKDLIYFTPSESSFGNFKDILIYIILFFNLHKTILHIHGGIGFKNIIFKNKYLKKINIYFLKKVKCIITLGEYHANNFKRVGLENVVEVHNFSNDELFFNGNSKIKLNEKIEVSYISNLIDSKGYKSVLNAAKILSHNNNVLFNFAGKFDSDSEKSDFMSQLKLLPNVKYHGVVTGIEKINLFKKTDIFALPTNYPYEGQPISILEAYASSCLVITCNHSGIPDIFSDQINGAYVEFNDHIDIKNKIIHFLDNKCELYDIQNNNYIYASKSFTLTKHLNKMKRVLFNG